MAGCVLRLGHGNPGPKHLGLETHSLRHHRVSEQAADSRDNCAQGRQANGEEGNPEADIVRGLGETPDGQDRPLIEKAKMNTHQNINDGSILMATPRPGIAALWPSAFTVIAARRGSDRVGSTTVYSGCPPVEAGQWLHSASPPAELTGPANTTACAGFARRSDPLHRASSPARPTPWRPWSGRPQGPS